MRKLILLFTVLLLLVPVSLLAQTNKKILDIPTDLTITHNGTGTDSYKLQLKGDTGGEIQYGGIYIDQSATALVLAVPADEGGTWTDFLTLKEGVFLFTDVEGYFGVSGDEDLLYLGPNEFNVEGDVSINGVLEITPVWGDLRVPLTSAPVGPGNNPGFDVFQGAIRQYAFDPDTEEELFFTAQLDHDYAYTTDLEPHLHWAPKTTDTGDCRWCIEYSLAEIGGVYGAPTTICGLQAGSGVAYEHQIVDLGNIDGSAINTLSATITGRVYRDADAGGVDTFTGDAYGIELDFHYQKDTVGSTLEFTK